MKRTPLITFAFLFAMATLAAAQYPQWLGQVQIAPPNPTSSDVVSITLSGEWYNSCTPNDSAVSVIGTTVYFDVVRDYGPWPICLPFCCPAWERTEPVGCLPPGGYIVYARLIPDWDVYEPVAIFIVTCQYYVAVDGNDSNDGLTPETAFATIQKGIDTAVNGDTVMVLPGTYTGPGNRDIDFLGKAIAVHSANGPDVTIIDCQNSGRGFHFHSGEDANSIVDGFTIKNGREWQGGGIRCTSSSPTISNCVIRDNEAVTSGMWAGEGGAIQCEESRMTLSNCHLVDNTSSGPGGAICSYSYSGTGNISLLNCTFIGNSAEEGGAIHCYRDNLTLLNCLIRDNTASKFGGGVHCRRINPTISNCTISHNSAFERGGGIYCWAGHTMVRNAILWDNCAPTGQEIKLNSSPFGSTQLTICYSVVQGGTDSVSVDSGCVLNWTAGNIDADPCFADPCNGDYHLQSTASRWDPNSETWITDANTSRCIDAGNPGSPPTDEPTPNGNRINMGAYGGTAKASKSPPNWALLSDLTNDRIMNHDDLRVFVGYWLESGENIPSDLDRNRSVDGSDYAIFAGQWSDTYVAEPTIAYEVYPCDPNQVQDSSEPRFRVWAEGSCIHFEDMMVANCCPDELELQMTVQGNLITIREIEHTTMPCHCICEYPITATLGPFEPGTYTLEVYQHNYSADPVLIGSTTVTIGSSQ